MGNIDSGDKVRSSVALGVDGQAYFVNDSGILFAVDSSGGEIWQFDTTATVVSSPAIGLEDEIYYTDQNGDLTAVTVDGEELWTFTIDVPIETTPVEGDNSVIFFGADDGLCMLLILMGLKNGLMKHRVPFSLHQELIKRV